MIHKPLEHVTKGDLVSLVEAGVAESRTLEYKRTLPASTDAAKKEFLADVSSFGNAGGGDLLYGVNAKDGIATEAIGLADFNEDGERLRLESTIRDGVSPRIPGIQIRAIHGFTKGPVLICRIPQSWAGPHMVIFKNSGKFYTRSSAGKFQMDVSDIRSAFEGASGISERIERWRTERLGRIIANEGPMLLGSTCCLIAHLVPLDSVGNEWRLHGSQIADQQLAFPPLASGGWDHRINIDGFVTYESDRNGRTRRYTQLFRSGRVEAVSSDIVKDRDGTRWIASIWYEKMLIESVSKYLDGLRQLNVQPPIVFLLSLTGAKGALMYTDAPWGDETPIDRNVITFPDVLIDAFDVDLPQVLRPVFDAVWNACGHSQSMNYDKQGKWNPR